MKYICRSKNESGFTLIEMAVVVVIVGIVISIMATVLPSLIQSAKISKAKAILEKVDYALQGYSMANNRLPFADNTGDGEEDTDVFVGNLPYRTIGLSSGEDAWGNIIKYAVYGESGGADNLTDTFANGDAFCVAISNGSTAVFTTNRAYTASNDDCSCVAASNCSNQAYVIASGGAKDLDGSNGFFDLCNGQNNPGFNATNKIQATDYDDLVRAFSLNELNYKNCTGGGGGGGGGCDGVESVYCGNCDDSEDNDGDGLPDCLDPDCATHPNCVNPTCDIATSSPLPAGNVNSDYSSVTFTTSDGCIGSCEWKLISDGGFTDFYLHSYTGHLSGTLSQCPKDSYTIKIGVTDSDSDNNPDPEKDFTIKVESNLSVGCESGCGQATCDEGTQICYDAGDTEKEAEFKIQGGHIGDITWVVDFGTAQGFYYEESGEGKEICTIKRNAATQNGKFTFHVTAKDGGCLSPDTNTAEDNFVVQVKVDLPPPLRADSEWRMDECSWDGTDGEVIDSGENRLDGTAKNGANTLDAGKICRAGSFDGSDDYVLIPDSDELDPSVITISAWIKWSINPTNGNNRASIVNKNGDNQYQLRHNNSNTKFEWTVKTDSGKTSVKGTTTPVLQEEWYFVTATYDGSELKLYVNGTLEKSESNTGYIVPSTSDVNIGGGSGSVGYFEGMIDEVMIFSRALSGDEIIDLYNRTRSSCELCGS